MVSPNGFSRRSFFKLAGSVTAAAGIASALSACGSKNDPAPAASGSAGGAAKTDGVIKAGISYELGTNGFDPMTTSAALTIAANWHTMEGLTEIHPATREVYAALAKEMPKKVNDTTWEATLRDGAVFHDGTPVTAEDVVYSFERVLNPDNNSLYRNFIPFIDTVEAKDATTVTFNLKFPFSLVPARLSVVKIVPKAIVEADKKAFDLNPVGTGPFKMTDNSASSKVLKFEAFGEYTGPYPAKVATMEWAVLPDGNTRTNALTSKEAQAIDSVPSASLATLAQQAQVEAKQGFGLLFTMFNCGSGAMQDVRNRQAVMYALDYEAICKTGMADLATPATSFVQKDHPAYKEASTVYTRDLDKAKALLAETGLTSTRLLCSNHDWFSAVRPIIKQNLEEAGLTVEYDEKKSSDVYSTIDGAADAYDIVVAPGDPSVFGDDADLLLNWWYGGDVWTDTRMHWKGSEAATKVADNLAAAAKAEGDEQKKLWHEIFDIVADQLPLYPIFHRKTPTAWDGETLVDFKPLAVTGLSFLEVGTK